ncbi:TraR/DksA family transcriptional regulator [Haliea sp. AH-315-K21]|uniref:Molecular chaperone DnaK n=1 Tax=SAR86 cluster bacterium TaxID=2030880 RepID=A0A2A5C9R4_9GAMM|nr:TraR/DksA family transcriptional regulator [Haliea sp. AH-315-K21]MBN4075551.1 TraR/DksA family transcriptional regulator [Gammaproteobacteria bacterium AH-315-E17]PCJ40609.1 MAG: molecular chaperone DnaK [SAR86 cluster bacterium]
MNSLNPEQIATLTAILEQLLSDLREQIELALPAAATVVLDQSKVGRLSRMDAMQQQHMADSTLQHAKKRLKLVQKALNKVPDEDYGYCEHCDEVIAFARLQISPEARLCLKCQSQQEQ